MEMENEDERQSAGERPRREPARADDDALAQELLRIQQRYAAAPLVDHRSADEIVGYDDLGLPR